MILFWSVPCFTLSSIIHMVSLPVVPVSSTYTNQLIFHTVGEKIEDVFEAVNLLEIGLKHSPYNFQIKLYLLQFYRLLGKLLFLI